MSFGSGLIVGAAFLVILLTSVDLGLAALRWLQRRLEQRSRPAEPLGGRTEECEVCAAEISILVTHLVTSTFGDDSAMGMGDGGTAMSAAYCSNHCPGGCRQGCEVPSAS